MRLDLRGKINCWSDNGSKYRIPYYATKYKDRLSDIKMVFFSRQIDLKYTAIDLRKFIETLPNLEYLDLGVTFCNGGKGKEDMRIMIKALCERGVIVDARRSRLDMILQDYSHDNLHLINKGDVFRASRCILCKEGQEKDVYFKCESCSILDDIKVWSIVYYRDIDNKYDHDMRPEWIRETVIQLNELADNIPDFVVNDVHKFLLHNKYHPCYPGEELITLESTRETLSDFMKEFKLEFDGEKVGFDGIIFNLFDLSSPGMGDIGWMFGWHTLFKRDAWSVHFDYPELEALYQKIH